MNGHMPIKIANEIELGELAKKLSAILAVACGSSGLEVALDGELGAG